MSNMSYCRFENTNGDLHDCVETMSEAKSFNELDLSPSEKMSYVEMREWCEYYLQEYDRLSETMHTVTKTLVGDTYVTDLK